MGKRISNEKKEYIEQIKKDMLERTNMTEQEAVDFAFRCWQCGYKKISDNNGWIPCSERLPCYYDNVLVCTENGGKTIAHLKHTPIEWRDMYMNKIDDVIAWQPLPGPYKECER